MLVSESSVKDSKLTRADIRAGRYNGPTAGYAPGFVQANLVILPADLAGVFARYCEANPKPCPILARTEPGDPRFHTLGQDIDVRTDLPRYRVWRNGKLTDEVNDILGFWREDLVAFALGCSFSFEQMLLEEGIELRHIRQGTNIPMFRTSIETNPVGPFSGPLVVTMRPLRSAHAIRAIEITSKYPDVHGSPVHIGFPEAIGIQDLNQPDWGDRTEIHAAELPVFWACGVTPQLAIERARPPFCITHAPGCMLITDLRITKVMNPLPLPSPQVNEVARSALGSPPSPAFSRERE